MYLVRSRKVKIGRNMTTVIEIEFLFDGSEQSVLNSIFCLGDISIIHIGPILCKVFLLICIEFRSHILSRIISTHYC